MTSKDVPVEPLVSELSFIELENRRLLDDNSIRLIAEVRSRNLLNDDEWIQIKKFLKEASEFLSSPPKTLSYTADGHVVFDPDADPFNADWNRIDAACRLAKRALPMWAALWLWKLRTDTSPTFWRNVGHIAGQLGYLKFPSEEAGTTPLLLKEIGAKHRAKHLAKNAAARASEKMTSVRFSSSTMEAQPTNDPTLGELTRSMEVKNELILEIGAEGGSIELLGTRAPNGWRFRTSTDEDCGEDSDGTPLTSHRESNWVDSWHAALALLDKYSWHCLHPLFVHPEFGKLVWEAVLERFDRQQSGIDRELLREKLPSWVRVCEPRPSSRPPA